MGNNIISNSFLVIGTLVLLQIFVSCNHETYDSKADILSHVMDLENNLTQTKIVNGITYSVSYRPTDLMVNQELQDSFTSKKIKELREKYKNFLYLNISLSKNEKELLGVNLRNRESFAKNVKQMVFGMRNKVHLYSKSKDTLELLDYVYPRTYGMGGASTMLFVFSREDVIFKEDFFFVTIEDLGYHTGDVTFKMLTEPIINEPKLKF